MNDSDKVQILGNPYEHWQSNAQVLNLHSNTIDLINHAQKSIRIMVYGINNTTIVDALLARKSSIPDIEIDVYVDFTQQEERSEALIKKMTDHNISVFYYHDRGSSLHMKLILIDRKWAIFSSANLTFRGENKNIEMGLVLSGPTVKNTDKAINSLIEELVSAGKIHQYSL